MFICHVAQHPGQGPRPESGRQLKTPNSSSLPGQQPDRLKNTLKPAGNLGRDMTLEEAENWLKKFEEWFIWNKAILDRKGYQTQRVLLENFLDERMLSKMHTDNSVTSETLIPGEGGLLRKLASYYIDDNPMINRHHAFTACKQSRGEPFMTWWERKMTILPTTPTIPATIHLHAKNGTHSRSM